MLALHTIIQLVHIQLSRKTAGSNPQQLDKATVLKGTEESLTLAGLRGSVKGAFLEEI